MNILVTGGAGYIGSHICVELLNDGHNVIVLDNFCNSFPGVLKRIQEVTGKLVFLAKENIQNREILVKILRFYQCNAVLHLAGLKSVSQSIDVPHLYYENNVLGTLRLLEAMQIAKVNTLIFSSSATVYGIPQCLPIPETHSLCANNPYAASKIIIENILRQIQCNQQEWRIGLLRYFNPIGAHASGLIGEHPKNVPHNLMPLVTQVAIGKYDQLSIFGNDYQTQDGTNVRDFIHVVDLAIGHLLVLKYLSINVPHCFTVNFGFGRGYSVLDIIHNFMQVSRKKLPYIIKSRRPGDIAISYADVTLARSTLGWVATRSLKTMCIDSWRWQKNNPNGF